MAYQIRCRKCEMDTWVGNIHDLIMLHTASSGRLICERCGMTETYIAQITGRWEQEPTAEWTEFIQGVIALPPENDGITPVLFMTAAAPDAEVSGIRVTYYRASSAHGTAVTLGPGTAPTVSLSALHQLLLRLARFGAIRPEDLESIAQVMRHDDGLAIAA